MEDLDTTLGVASSPTLIPRARFLQPECQQEVPALRQWLNAIRPEGRGYVFSISENSKIPRQFVFDNHAEAIALITAAITRNEDVFVALARFREGSTNRKSEFTESFLSVWVDIDCGERKPYQNKDSAVDALLGFVEKMQLPHPSPMVDSGNGIHAYWCFKDPITKVAWKTCAEQLKCVCHSLGLEIDRLVTADAARVMRVPSSLNYKDRANPKAVSVIGQDINGKTSLIDFNDFSQKLEIQPQAVPPQKQSEGLLLAGLGQRSSFEPSATTRSLIGDAETPEAISGVSSALEKIDPDVSYQEWFQCLCAVKSTGWDCAYLLAKDWSSRGQKYDEATFDKQWNVIQTYGGIGLGTLLQKAAKTEIMTVDESASIAEVNQPGDIRNGKAFAALYRRKLLYIRPIGNWFLWDMNRWKICMCGEEMEAAKETAKCLLTEAATIARENPDRGKRLFSHALQTQNLPRLEAMLRLAASEEGMVVGRASELDSDPWLLGTQNGVVNLKTGDLLAPSPEMLITKQCNAPFNADAKCPQWSQFLEEIFAEDHETIESVQRLLGYTLTGSTAEEVMVICYGGGTNGKSVFSNVVSNIIGEYFTIGPNCLLVARNTNDNSVRNDLAKLVGARLVSVNELKQGARLDEQVIKQLAGREPMSARFLHKEFFDFMPTGKVWLRTNHRPIVTGEDDGIWRRLALLPFKVTFSAEECDVHLQQKLLQEREGILAWMVRGAIKWQEYGLMLSPTIRAESMAYRKESDMLGEFLEDETLTDPSVKIGQGEVFMRWGFWCTRNGVHAGSKKGFTRKLAERGYTEYKSNGRRFYQGLKLTQPSG